MIVVELAESLAESLAYLFAGLIVGRAAPWLAMRWDRQRGRR